MGIEDMLRTKIQALEAIQLFRPNAIPAGGVGGSSAAWTESSVVKTRLVSVKVGRRVVKGTERTRASPLSIAGCSPPNNAAALLDGACTKISAAACSLSFHDCRVS